MVWGRVALDPWAELQVDPARGPQVLHHPNRRTVIRVTHHIVANRDIMHHISYSGISPMRSDGNPAVKLEGGGVQQRYLYTVKIGN